VTAHGEAGNGGLLRLRLDLGYDGGRFSGWARQPGRRTVQAVVEQAVGVVLRLGGPAGLTVSGRTEWRTPMSRLLLGGTRASGSRLV
jgi:hypothetical protein